MDIVARIYSEAIQLVRLNIVQILTDSYRIKRRQKNDDDTLVNSYIQQNYNAPLQVYTCMYINQY